MQKLLLIEDETLIRENLAELLTLNGFDVYTAPNGKEGLMLATQHQPDLILCDVMMPELDGFQTLEIIRANPSLSNTPFLFLTAKADVMDTRKGMALGADDYLTKPFKMDTLLMAIQARLKREEQRKAHTQALLQEQLKAMTHLSTHEYNTPLTGILGFTSLLIDYYGEFSKAENLSMLDMIKVNCLRLKRSLDNNRLINRLQNISTSDAFYHFFSTGHADITPDVLNKHILSASYRQNRQIPCHVDVENAQVHISADNLATILEELTDNAVKFSADDQLIHITGHLCSDHYELTFLNQGQPFHQDDINRTAPYRQFDRPKYEQQGFGLGIAITNKLLEFNKGSLHIENVDAGRTQVVVHFPIG